MFTRYVQSSPCAITFDLDGVLADNWALINQVYGAWLATALNIPLELAAELNEKYVSLYGDSVVPLAEQYNVPNPEAWISRCYEECHRQLAKLIPSHIKRDETLYKQVIGLKSRGHQTFILTSAYPDYTRAMLKQLGLLHTFRQWTIMTRICVDGHRKTTPEPYIRQDARLTHLTGRAHIMVEDQSRNLFHAAARGRTTVLVGPEIHHKRENHVHARYPTVHEFLTDFQNGRFEPDYI